MVFLLYVIEWDAKSEITHEIRFGVHFYNTYIVRNYRVV